MPYATTARVLEVERQARDIYALRLQCAPVAAQARAGQFLQVAPSKDGMPLLNRPISISDAVGDCIELLVARIGPGTEKITRFVAGDTVRVIGPLGNGFSLNPLPKRVLLVGGGIGIAPLRMLARVLHQQNVSVDAVLGFNTIEDVYGRAFFEGNTQNTWVTTTDGSCGIQGHACVPLDETVVLSDYDQVCACGPKPMLRNLARRCLERNVPCSLSLEEYMACGIGVCLGCSVRTYDREGTVVHSRVCDDGPVFSAKEVVFDD